MGPFWSRTVNGRHVRHDPPLVPQPRAPGPGATVPVPVLPEAPAARFPVALGDGALLRDSAAPAARPVFTGLRDNPGEPAAAVICLGGGCAVDVTRTLWLDELAAAVRYARAALAQETRQAAAITGGNAGTEDETKNAAGYTP